MTGFRPLLAATLRQDRLNIAPWVALLSVLSASSIIAYDWLFPDPSDRAALALSLGANPALSLVFGPAHDLMTSDGFNAWRAGQLGALFTALMAILAVVRNSRAHEDSGQAELLASGVMSRSTRLAVAVAIACIGSLAVGVVSFLLTIACGGGAIPSLLLSTSFTASGFMFAGVAAVAAQLGADARTSTSIAVGTLGILYFLRGYIDSSDFPGWAAWLTPLGWLERVEPATANDARPLLAAFALSFVLFAVAFALQARRDFGQGLIAPRPGPSRAGVAGSVPGLIAKTHAGSAATWAVAFAGLGLMIGNLVASIGSVAADNPAIREFLAASGAGPESLSFRFIATFIQIIGIIAAISGVQVALRIRSEELAHRVEPLLAGALPRHRYFAANAVAAAAMPAAGMLIAGTSLGVVAHGRDASIAVGDVVLQAAATIPAVWILVGIALAVVGAAPGKAVAAWLGVIATFGLTLLGPTFKLPDWALGISPLRHVPDIMSASDAWVPLAWLCAIAVIAAAIGFAGFRRRDIG